MTKPESSQDSQTGFITSQVLFGKRLWQFEDHMCMKYCLSLQFWHLAVVLGSLCEESVIHSRKSCSVFSALSTRDCLMLFFYSSEEADQLYRSCVVRAYAQEVGDLYSIHFMVSDDSNPPLLVCCNILEKDIHPSPSLLKLCYNSERSASHGEQSGEFSLRSVAQQPQTENNPFTEKPAAKKPWHQPQGWEASASFLQSKMNIEDQPPF